MRGRQLQPLLLTTTTRACRSWTTQGWGSTTLTSRSLSARVASARWAGERHPEWAWERVSGSRATHYRPQVNAVIRKGLKDEKGEEQWYAIKSMAKKQILKKSHNHGIEMLFNER